MGLYCISVFFSIAVLRVFGDILILHFCGSVAYIKTLKSFLGFCMEGLLGVIEDLWQPRSPCVAQDHWFQAFRMIFQKFEIARSMRALA